MYAAPRNSPLPFTFLVALTVALLASLLAGRDAFADGRHDIDIGFSELEARVEHGELQVTYTIQGKDWREIQRAHIRPKLNLYLPTRHGRQFQFVTAVPITSRSATVIFSRDMTPDRARNVELRLSGDRGHTRIATTSFGASCGTRVRVALQESNHRGRDHDRDGDHEHHGPSPDSVAIIEACAGNTSWSGDLAKCIERGKRLDRGAASAINACGAATSWSGDFLSCLDLSANLGRNRTGTIDACKAATNWSGDFKACLVSASAYRADASPVIRACSAATSWSGEFKQCLDSAHRG